SVVWWLRQFWSVTRSRRTATTRLHLPAAERGAALVHHQVGQAFTVAGRKGPQALGRHGEKVHRVDADLPAPLDERLDVVDALGLGEEVAPLQAVDLDGASLVRPFLQRLLAELDLTLEGRQL